MRPARPGEQTWWEEAFDTWWWLDRFGLTPAQVAELPIRDVKRVPLVAALVDKIRADKQKDAARKGR